MALGVALLAPALLAGGLVAGEQGYRMVGQRSEAVVGAVRVVVPQRAPAVRAVAFEPVLTPAPPHPDVVYEAAVWMPSRVSRPMSEVRAVGRARRARVPASTAGLEARPERRTAKPAPTGCPEEWRETWLWDVCRKREQQPA